MDVLRKFDLEVKGSTRGKSILKKEKFWNKPLLIVLQHEATMKPFAGGDIPLNQSS